MCCLFFLLSAALPAASSKTICVVVKRSFSRATCSEILMLLFLDKAVQTLCQCAAVRDKTIEAAVAEDPLAGPGEGLFTPGV